MISLGSGGRSTCRGECTELQSPFRITKVIVKRTLLHAERVQRPKELPAVLEPFAGQILGFAQDDEGVLTLSADDH